MLKADDVYTGGGGENGQVLLDCCNTRLRKHVAYIHYLHIL